MWFNSISAKNFIQKIDISIEVHYKIGNVCRTPILPKDVLPNTRAFIYNHHKIERCKDPAKKYNKTVFFEAYSSKKSQLQREGVISKSESKK